MKKRLLYRLMPLLSLFLLSYPTIAKNTGNGKKVYADYHGVRYTRNHDGMLGRWTMYADTQKSHTGINSLCYNADNLSGDKEPYMNEIASVHYPILGIQSDLDEDYIEYQILSAKTAGIDGFFIEWGFMGHENDVLLKAMQKVAARYDFEIGVNWCDGWLYYDWITKRYPEINTRKKKTEHYVRCYQYLIDSVFTGVTAPIVKGYPVFYLFGPGATVEEYKWAYERVRIPVGMNAPVVLRRWADWGRLENNRYIPVTHSEEIDEWIGLGAVPTAWLPARVRIMDAAHPYWDNYAETEDLIEFMKPFRDSIWNNPNPVFRIKSGFVMPGMDNRGCAGWGRGHFFYIPRDRGETYRKMWRFNIANKDSLDMVFIASWSDFTEGHEIAPTRENGIRELETTLYYSSLFKEKIVDKRGLLLPERLFYLRKQFALLKDSGIDIDKKQVRMLNDAAKYISKEKYKKADGLLRACTDYVLKMSSRLMKENLNLSEKDLLRDSLDKQGYDVGKSLKLYLPKDLHHKLLKYNYEGYICFEYLDEGDDFIRIYSETNRIPKDKYSVVGSIRKNKTGQWKPVRIRLYKGNIFYKENNPAFYIKGRGHVRNIMLQYQMMHYEND